MVLFGRLTNTRRGYTNMHSSEGLEAREATATLQLLHSAPHQRKCEADTLPNTLMDRRIAEVRDQTWERSPSDEWQENLLESDGHGFGFQLHHFLFVVLVYIGWLRTYKSNVCDTALCFLSVNSSSSAFSPQWETRCPGGTISIPEEAAGTGQALTIFPHQFSWQAQAWVKGSKFSPLEPETQVCREA